MKKYILLTFFLIIATLGCSNNKEKTTIVTTIHPIAEIIKQLMPNNIEVICLVPPGQSPHTFSLSPSEQHKLEIASAIFYVSNELDGWATKTENKNKFCLINMLSDSLVLYFIDDHKHSDSNNIHSEQDKSHSQDNLIKDPHFWTDPLAVKSIINNLVTTFESIFKDNQELIAQIKDKANKLKIELINLNEKTNIYLASLKNKPVFLFHPSFRYFIKRYGLRYMGAIEPSPGKEPTPNYIAEIVEKIKVAEVKAIFSEPQLPDKTALMIAEAAKVKLFILDPIGGVQGRMSYFDLIQYNSEIFKRALE